MVKRIERDLATKLLWAAVNHFNTDHPHIHLVIRGIDQAGNEVRFPAPYIKDFLESGARHWGWGHLFVGYVPLQIL